MRKITIMVLLLAVAGMVAGIQPPTEMRAGPVGKIYWTEVLRIWRADQDGSTVEELVTGLDQPAGIALDVTGGKMYWSDTTADKIQRANLDGSDVEDLVTTELGGPFGMALDVARGKMYWTDFGAAKIQRANLDGSDVEHLVTTGLVGPAEIALDVVGGKMYWTDTDADKIQRANLDGSDVEDLVTEGLDGPVGMALDMVGGKMYWTNFGAGKIQRANLDGGSVEDLVTGLTTPYGIVVDVSGSKMYWTSPSASKIQRANLDGSDVDDLLTGLAFPVGIALEFPPPVAQVSIDIKPGSESNPITTRSRGVVPVAILSSPAFDAPSEVDKASLTFGRTGDEESIASCLRRPRDVNHDGLLDQVCHFKAQAAGFQVGDSEGILRGQTAEGVPLGGRDAVRIVR